MIFETPIWAVFARSGNPLLRAKQPAECSQLQTLENLSENLKKKVPREASFHFVVFCYNPLESFWGKTAVQKKTTAQKLHKRSRKFNRNSFRVDKDLLI